MDCSKNPEHILPRYVSDEKQEKYSQSNSVQFQPAVLYGFNLQTHTILQCFPERTELSKQLLLKSSLYLENKTFYVRQIITKNLFI